MTVLTHSQRVHAPSESPSAADSALAACDQPPSAAPQEHADCEVLGWRLRGPKLPAPSAPSPAQPHGQPAASAPVLGPATSSAGTLAHGKRVSLSLDHNDHKGTLTVCIHALCRSVSLSLCLCLLLALYLCLSTSACLWLTRQVIVTDDSDSHLLTGTAAAR